MNKYLLEIGTEELPYKFVNTGLAQLKSSFEKLLKENQIHFSEIKSDTKLPLSNFKNWGIES